MLVLVAAALAGTAGLASLRSEGGCRDHWSFTEGTRLDAHEPLSLWPPGVACRLVDADGTIVGEVDRSGWGFIALLALGLALLAAALRWRTPKPLALRAAASAAAGLLTWGIGSLYGGAVLGATLSLVCLVGPLAGFAADRHLSRAGGVIRRRTDGLFGLVVGPCATILGLFAWIVVTGPLAAAVTVALVAAAVGLAGGRRSERPNGRGRRRRACQ